MSDYPGFTPIPPPPPPCAACATLPRPYYTAVNGMQIQCDTCGQRWEAVVTMGGQREPDPIRYWRKVGLPPMRVHRPVKR